ncbi:hypothetical protein C8K30_11546 [Promicromonospora sp. AC04]|nr:hypothetical protein C8K30_11546 [Promicromonospora sp. AC04]
MESVFDDATSGTSMLRMRSQQARIAAARGDEAGMVRALIAADTASREESLDQPGVFGFASGKAAYYTSEAYRETGQTARAVRSPSQAILSDRPAERLAMLLGTQSYCDVGRTPPSAFSPP